MRKLTIIFILGILVSTIMPVKANIAINFNNNSLMTDNLIRVANGVTLVPIRLIVESFGAFVDWNDLQKEAIITHQNVKVRVPIGKEYVIVNRKRLILSEPAIVVRGTTLVPLRVISMAFGAEIIYYPNKNCIDINMPKQWQTASLFAFDNPNNLMYVYSQGNNFSTSESLPRKLTILDKYTGEIILTIDDLLSEQNSLVVYDSYLYQYRFIPYLEKYGLTRQNLNEETEIIETLDNPTVEMKDKKLIGIVNDFLYIYDCESIKRLNIEDLTIDEIYVGKVGDVHLSQKEIILLDEGEIIRIDLEGNDKEILVKNIKGDNAKGFVNSQIKAVGDEIFFIDGNCLKKVNIEDKTVEVIISNYDSYVDVVVSESTEEDRVAELMDNFLPTDKTIYLSKTEEELIDPMDVFEPIEYLEMTEQMNNFELKGFKKNFRSCTQNLFNDASNEAIFSATEKDYRFGSNGSVFPLMRYMFINENYIYLEKIHKGESTIFRMDLDSHEIEPLIYNIKMFEYN